MTITTIRKVPTSAKAVCLTFDDGPHSVYTPLALEALHKYNSDATWFILGKQAQSRLGMLTDIYLGGNDIGVHSYDHVRLTGLSRSQISSQLGRTKALIQEATGHFWPYFRPTDGAFNQTVLEVADSLGFEWNVLWSVDPRDYQASAGQIISRVMAGVQPGAIIILHEVTAPTTQALPVILEEIGNRGYQAVTFSELLKLAEEA
ncbi:polysaccharide deacetylase family protein [hydrocarbon metagenome]|uniref:Polysaccharide deacetylase family protein n=1 Tax=hydrocarbon metagenome TaxID=938273 RepID=A0A0W8E6L4_9ZZZZ